MNLDIFCSPTLTHLVVTLAQLRKFQIKTTEAFAKIFEDNSMANKHSSSALRRTLVLCVLSLVSFSANGAEDQAAPMSKLAWLLGEWAFSDEAVDGSYRETGTRSCNYVLDESYIQCESRGVSNSGHERSYFFIVGYNSMDSRYEMIGLTSSYPRQNLYVLKPSQDGNNIELDNNFWSAEGILPGNSATISYNGSDQYVWQIRTGDRDPQTGRRAVGFIDTVTRIAD